MIKHARRAFLLTVLVALAHSAGASLLAGDMAKAMQGKWKADLIATVKESDHYKKMPPDQQKVMLDQMGQGPAMVLEFDEKTATAKAGDEPAETATYTITKTEGRVLHLDVLAKKDGQDRHELMTMEIVDADNARMSKIGDGFVLVLHRVK